MFSFRFPGQSVTKKRHLAAFHNKVSLLRYKAGAPSEHRTDGHVDTVSHVSYSLYRYSIWGFFQFVNQRNVKSTLTFCIHRDS